MAFLVEEVEELPAGWEAKYLDCRYEQYSYSVDFIKDGLTVNMLIPEKYPVDHPVIEIRGNDWKNIQEDMKRRIMQSVHELAKVYVGQAMLNVLLEEVWTMIKFKPRETSEAHKQCAKPVQHGKKQKKTDVSQDLTPQTKIVVNNTKNKHFDNCKTDKSLIRKKGQKLPSMKTAKDVINRLKWDEQLKDGNFVVGYEDRFQGIIEVPVWSLNWEDDIAATGPDDKLVIPEHRIQHFKWNSEIVWERKTRTDLMFGSTGSGCDIVEFIKRYKAQIRKDSQQCQRSIFDERESDDGTGMPESLIEDQSTCRPTSRSSNHSLNPSHSGISANPIDTNHDLKAL